MNKEVTSLNDPRLLALITIALFSLGPLVAKLLSIQSEFLLIFLSFSFTFVTFLIGLFVFRRARLKEVLSSIKLRYFFFGLFGYFFYWHCFFQSLREFSSASGSTVLNYTWPIFTVIFTEIFFRRSKRKLSLRIVQTLGILFGFAAVVVLATEGKVSALEIPSLSGLLWGLGSGVSYGLFSSFTSSVPSKDHLAFLTASVFISLVAMLPFAYSELHLLSTLHPGDYATVAFLGCAIDGIGYLAWASANRKAMEKDIDISSVASLIFFLPAISIAILSYAMGENELYQRYFLVTLLLLLISTILCQRSEHFAKLLQRK